MPTLYDTLSLRGKPLRNRIAMAPMLTTHKPIEGIPTPWHIEYYRQRAADGAGMVIVECTATDPDGRNSLGEFGLYLDEHVASMGAIASAIHEGGALALVQIHSSGRVTPAAVNAGPSAPSAETLKDGRNVREMSDEEVVRNVEWFGDAARRACEAGFDGIELHGCHGYLINQFVSPKTNRRTDRWGGDTVSARCAFSRAVIADVRAKTPDDFLLGYRMGFNDPDGETGVQIAREIAACGVDYLHISGGIGPEPMPSSEGEDFGFWLAARAVKQAVDVPVIAVNMIHTLAIAERVVEQGFADIAAVARPYLLNADWMTAQKEGRPLVRCLNCRGGGCRYLLDGCPYIKMP